MNVMVFDVPAESGGALSILNDFYKQALSYEDKSITWIFIVSKPNIKDEGNIKVMRFPWVKKSWWHRLYFDNFIAPKLIKKNRVDKIINFQNVIIPYKSIPQVMYIHQPLPFVDYKFAFNENRLYWFYQNVIGKSIIKSIKKASKVIVQTEWMKRACMEKCGVGSEKIDVIFPQVYFNTKKFFEPNKKSLSTFFYPANGITYKNHQVIIGACKKLKDRNIKDFKVIFTLEGDENDCISRLCKEVSTEQLPVEFTGKLSRDQVFDLYTRSVLVFPSYIETFGLPMLEARLHKGIIVASDSPFSHEVLDRYENVYYFDAFSEEDLSRLMEKFINEKINYYSVNKVDEKAIHKGINIVDIINGTNKCY
jgi:glycosyltransferase involved in cell wall biosynthesis